MRILSCIFSCCKMNQMTKILFKKSLMDNINNQTKDKKSKKENTEAAEHHRKSHKKSTKDRKTSSSPKDQNAKKSSKPSNQPKNAKEPKETKEIKAPKEHKEPLKRTLFQKNLENEKYYPIYAQMKEADNKLNFFMKEFGDFNFYVDIESPVEIFEKFLRLSDHTMAEKLVNLMKIDGSINYEKLEKIIDLILKPKDKNEKEKAKLFFKCFSENTGNSTPFISIDNIKKIIAIGLKRNGVITLSPEAEKSYVDNFITKMKLPNNSLNEEQFISIIQEKMPGILDLLSLDQEETMSRLAFEKKNFTHSSFT
ncbi:hypothetical protein TRFO_01191 [Tritrichomonas foetus]|uniref:Uncharacterized protein n=1 Tax=Tritrichomonas foetus TaxID=1144522 RepID=A0A1J4KIN0_9EUKA|nr:hypothetical protein TRFO_01191 [Tritrichomonas foetus]|eukprot:OHT11233.1 hypothetical protein TRFO_01191 [Tritrichomonas foetus]